MAVTDWKSPSSTGETEKEWQDATNAYSSNNAYAIANYQNTSNTINIFCYSDIKSVVLGGTEQIHTVGSSSDLWGEVSISPSSINGGVYVVFSDGASQDYTFSGFDIPLSATIDGIEISIEGYGIAPIPRIQAGVDYIDHIQMRVYYTESATTANSERGLYIAGYSTSNSTRGLYIQGSLTSNSTRGLYIEGFVDTLYSRESSASLKADDSNLLTMFSEQDYTDVATDDDAYVDLEGTARYFQLLFKEPNGNENNTDDFRVTWKGKSTLAPSSSAVYLQIYNRTTESWTTLASNSSASANVEFTLEGTVSTDLSDYYDTNYIISVRVYQDGVV